MQMKKVFLGSLILIAVVAILMSVTGRIIYAQSSGGSDPAVLEKLGEVLRNQKIMMEGMAAISEDLRIIKIRITQSQ